MNQKGMGDMLKQVSKMKKDMERVNDDLKNRYIEEQSGGGLVSVTVNGQQEIVKISIDPSVLQAGDDGQVDLEMFEDMLIAAINQAVGKSKAMEMCLTGRMMDAAEAERSGLASRVIPAAQLIEEALATATTIAQMSRPSVFMAKASVNRAYETNLAQGVAGERIMFQSLFATEDQKEGMAAFAEKRPPQWKNR